MHSELLWTSLAAPGYETVCISEEHPGWNVFDSMFVREHDGQVYRGGYSLITNKEWNTLEIRFMIEESPGKMISQHLLADGGGRWTNADERPIPRLFGCYDVDIQWSPLTNSLPINRLKLDVGQREEIKVIYFALPALELSVRTQVYERIDATTVRYSSGDGEFTQDIRVDDQGFVVEYPDLFTRTWPRPE